MNEAVEMIIETPPKKAPAKRRKKARKARAPKVDTTAKPVKTSDEFSGISATACPAACTAERCVISTVGVCKHPCKSADSGCGPITLANRARAKKLIKHQMVDARE